MSILWLYTVEDEKHFLLMCPSYSTLRDTYLEI